MGAAIATVPGNRLCLCALLAIGACWTTPTKAQGVIPAGMLRLAGARAECAAIPTLIVPMADIAMTQPGWIILHPALFSLPPAVQHFWYAHECAHQLLGADEAAADCWAAQTGRRAGWFRRDDFQWFDRAFADHPGDATHAAGRARVAHIRACYAKE